MLDIHAQTVYIDTAVYQRTNCAARLSRLMARITCDDVRECDATSWRAIFDVGRRRHGKDGFDGGPVLAFTTWDENRTVWFYHWRDEAAAHQGVCQPGLELNNVDGCVFRCAYCGFGRFIVFYLDVERFIDGFDDVFAKYPDQRLFKYSNMTDLPAFEPELDTVGPVVETFAKQHDRYVMLFTKSDNVHFLADLDHRGHTIVSWSLTSDTISRLIDRRTATLDERIAAMKFAQDAGYIVRARLSPVIPVKNWRDEYTRLFEKLYAEAKPDIVTLELVGWLPYSDLKQIISADLLDSDFLDEAKAAADELSGIPWGPYTQRQHEEIYRHCIETSRHISPDTPVSVCHGTAATWQNLGTDMPSMSPGNYLCNCGPFSTPGGKLYDELITVG